MSVIKDILLFPYNIMQIMWKGFYFLISEATLGFYSYFVWFFRFLRKIFTKNKFICKTVKHFEVRREQPEALLSLIFVVCFTLTFYSFVTHNVDLENNTLAKRGVGETVEKKSLVDLYKKYGYYTNSDIDIDELKKTNSDTVAWLKVDNTNINYPVVKSNDNKYYRNHTFDKNVNDNGWIYMDYRNNTLDLSFNTIIYGKELEDKEGFGDINYIFSDSYLKNSNKMIKLIMSNDIYEFKVFSIYVTNNSNNIIPDFFNQKSSINYLKSIYNKSIKDFEIEVEDNDKILSLVTVDNDKEVKIVHAKLIKTSNIEY